MENAPGLFSPITSPCQGSVPEAIIAFLESEDYEDAIRKAVSIGGESDTIACIADSIAHAFYKEIPSHILFEVKETLPVELWQVVERFCSSTNFSINKLNL
jgi:ADP-ribosylglycohydrolase